MTEEAQLERQNMLLRQNMERVEVKYLKAVRDGITSPVVVIFDLEDQYARDQLKARAEDVQQQVARARRLGIIPVGVWHGPSVVAAPFMGKSTPEGVALREGHAPVGTFPVVVLGSGLASLAHVAIPD